MKVVEVYYKVVYRLIKVVGMLMKFCIVLINIFEKVIIIELF